MTYIDLNIRMLFVQSLQSLRGSNNAHKLDVLATMFLDLIDRIHCRTTCCQHRVTDHNSTLLDRIRQFAIIFLWLMCFLITIHSNMTYFRRWHQCQNAGYHAKTGTKDRNNGKFTACDHWCHTLLDRSLDLNIFHRKI